MRSVIRLAVLVGWVLAGPALAQRVVVLEVDGDTSHKLRAQIEAAVKRAGVVEVLSLQAYKEAAARKKLRGAAAFTPAGVARTSRVLRLDAAVSGEISGSTYRVMIWDRGGQQLWTKDLPLKKGLLSEEFAAKLARAIAAAAEQGAAKADPTPPVEAGSTEPVEPESPDLPPKPDPGGDREPPPDDPNHDADLDDLGPKKVVLPAPPIIAGRLMGSTTWRSQCLRPGVKSCKEYDLASTKPQGIVIDFTPSVPYFGLALDADLYPLARFPNRFLNGLGVVAAFNFGQSITKINAQTPQGSGPDTFVTSVEVGWAASLVWRYHFFLGLDAEKRQATVGFVGVRVGLGGRNFTIDPTAGTPLPSSQRVFFPSIGLDASVPIVSYLHVDAGFSWLFSPKPSAEQIVGYGSQLDPTGGVLTTGFAIEAGVSGHVWGPLGYIVHLRYTNFADRYYGQGQKWTVCNDSQCGGAAEESFIQIVWGATAQF
jgi:hypothetical protein